MNPDQNTQLFLNSSRWRHIRATKYLALQHDRCKEKFEDKCAYPHCQCLHGENGPIDPVTGEEYAKEEGCEGGQCKL